MASPKQTRVERRLAAILAADVAGFSRLIGADEEGTLQRLKAIRKEVIDPAIAAHHGRLVKTTGDGFLVEFTSVVDAVRCAVGWQSGTAEQCLTGIEFRIGINVGDIVVEDDDIFGDGVNVAARLEALAQPGGICVSARVHEDVVGRLDLVFEDIGEQQLKNIARSVRVFRVLGLGTSYLPAPQTERGTSGLSISDKPSIAVLPFRNMSGDPEQEYFADGMVEDITTAIARLPWLFVIARNSSFTYKGKAVDVKQIGRELGVRYALEGSVRRSGNRVRITGQLIDTTTGAHIWADKIDGSLDDIFELQDQVASKVVGAIEPRLRDAEIARASGKPTNSLDAYDLYLRALAQFHMWSADSFQEAVRLLRGALAIDPSYAPAAALFGFCRGWQRSNGWEPLSDEGVVEAVGFVRQAVDTAKNDPDVLWMAGQVLSYFAYDEATGLDLIERALALNPNSALAWSARGYVLTFANQPQSAIESFDRAMRLSPLDPFGYMFKNGIAMAHTLAGRFEEAMEWVDQTLREQPRQPVAVRFKAALYGHLGNAEEARKWIRVLLTLYPGATIKSIQRIFNNPSVAAVQLDGLRKAGLPEE